MNVVGLVVEYNPFHTGHLYHLQQSVARTAADYVICVMSGNFLQRGEPALLDKWHRAAMALAGGADVVLELPAAFATQSAESFAAGAVAILNATGITTHLSFGSEVGDLAPLLALSRILAAEPPALRAGIKAEMNQGLVYPAARARALSQYLAGQSGEGSPFLSPGQAADLLSEPNNILAIEYLKAILTTDSSLIPLTVPRVSTGYHDPELPLGNIASATAIRRALQPEEGAPGSPAAESLEEIRRVVPAPTFAILTTAFQSSLGPVFPEHFASIILSTLRRSSPGELATIIDVSEGLEHRLLDAARRSGSIQELLQAVKTKRYTLTRIQRILVHAALSYTATDAALFKATGPQYLRVLGYSTKGRQLLRAMRSTASLPLVQRVAPALRQARPAGVHPESFRRMLQMDILATDLYTLGLPHPADRRGGRDFTHPPVCPPT